MRNSWFPLVMVALGLSAGPAAAELLHPYEYQSTMVGGPFEVAKGQPCVGKVAGQPDARRCRIAVPPGIILGVFLKDCFHTHGLPPAQVDQHMRFIPTQTNPGAGGRYRVEVMIADDAEREPRWWCPRVDFIPLERYEQRYDEEDED